METKLTEEQFVLLAIDRLADPKRKTIHTVYSEFNKAFREYFPKGDPIKTVAEMFAAGKISYRLCRGGAIIALPGVIEPAKTKALEVMGLTKPKK